VARGALRGAAGAWLGLIALQAVTTKRGSKQVSGLLTWVDSAVQRALSPDVAAIPDYSKGVPAPAATKPAGSSSLPYQPPYGGPTPAPGVHPLPN
jgi:hypothetical protein